MTVYLDLVMVLNFLVDFCLLQGTNRLSGFPAEVKRSAAAALVGAVYAGVCLLPGFAYFRSLLWRSVSFAVMSVIAFGWNRMAVRKAGVFLLLSLAMGGLALSIGREAWLSLLLSGAGLWMLCLGVFSEGLCPQSYIPLELSWGNNRLNLTALRDTGNTLRDPISGEQVLVLSAEAARRLTGLTEAQLRKPLETLSSRPVPGLQLIPYRAVGTGAGFLLGLRLENARVDGKPKSIVAAFAPEGLGQDGMFQALAGGAL